MKQRLISKGPIGNSKRKSNNEQKSRFRKLEINKTCISEVESQLSGDESQFSVVGNQKLATERNCYKIVKFQVRSLLRSY